MPAYTITLTKIDGGFQAAAPQFGILLFAPSLELAYNLACAAFQTCFLAIQQSGTAIPEPEPDPAPAPDSFHLLFHFPPRRHAPNELVWRTLPPSLVAFCDQAHQNWPEELCAFASAHAAAPDFDQSW